MDRTKTIKKVGIAGIAGNIFLLIIKMSIGILSKSQAMIADAINSATDIFSSLMSFIGNKIASKDQDEDHNFGHGNAEYIFSFLIALSMILLSIKIIYSSVMSLINPVDVEYPLILIIICITTIITKLFLFIHANAMYKKHQSILIDATKKDHRNDCIITTFTLISVVLGMYGIKYFDGIVGIGIALWIFYTGAKIFIESYDVLMGVSVDNETKNQILDIIKKYPDIKQTQHFSSSAVGYRYLISITIYIDGNMPTYQSHDIADKLEKEINALPQVYLSIIHVNPYFEDKEKNN